MKLKNISKNYKKANKNICIFDDLSIEFEKGKFYAIIGESGSGKSTLINILGLLSPFDKGEYYIDNLDVKKMSDNKLSEIRMSKIGLIFQDYYLNPRLTAYENVVIATMINKKIKKEDRHNIVMKLLDKLKLTDRAKHYPEELSGGEQQRVCIARALVNDPDFILADEPTGSLDPTNAKIIIEILNSLRDDGKCVIMVTHDMSLIKNADYIYEISNKNLMRQ